MQIAQPYSEPDWDGWIYMPQISRLEAVCLSMNICPQDAQEGYGILDAMRSEDEDGFGPIFDDQDAAAVFRRRMFVSRHFGRQVKLVDFVKFAEQLRWEIPTQLASVVGPPKAASSSAKVEPTAMHSAVLDSAQTVKPVEDKQTAPYPSIEDETRTHVGTSCAAYWLSREKQTLRTWASKENGPIRPTRINRRLAWSVEEIRELLKK